MNGLSDLDVVYASLKRTEREGRPLQVGPSRSSAASALSNYFVSSLRSRIKDDVEYRRTYETLAPKAMILITCVIGVVRELALGESAQVEAFLGEVARRG